MTAPGEAREGVPALYDVERAANKWGVYTGSTDGCDLDHLRLALEEAHAAGREQGRREGREEAARAGETEPDQRGPMTWGVSGDEENFHGHYATKEEALAAAPSELAPEGLDPGARFWVGGGRLWRPTLSVDADDLFEHLADHAGDECGEIAVDWLSAVARSDADALEEELHRVVLSWLKRTGNLPDFYCCEVVEEHRTPPAQPESVPPPPPAPGEPSHPQESNHE